MGCGLGPVGTEHVQRGDQPQPPIKCNYFALKFKTSFKAKPGVASMESSALLGACQCQDDQHMHAKQNETLATYVRAIVILA